MHDPAITDRVSGQDRSQTAFHESSASCDYAKVFDEPVPAWRVVSANTEESRSEALRSNRGPLVGRYLELEQLRAVLSACRTDGRAALLKDFEIRPVVVHPTKRADVSRHGYRAAQFEDAIARFLPPEPNIRTLKRGGGEKT